MSRRSRKDPLAEGITGLAGLFMLGWFFIPGFRVLVVWGGAAVVVLLIGFIIYRVANSSRIRQPVTYESAYADFRGKPATSPSVHERAGLSAGIPSNNPFSPNTESLADILHRIDWFQFEKLTAAIYRAEGYSVQRLGGAKPDGGVDLLIERDGTKTVVQCKHWKTREVPEKEIREFLGTLTDTGIRSGIFVTMCGYTQPAEQLARKHGIALVGEADLISSLEKINWKYNPDIQALLDDKRKFCPRCENPMVQRTAKKGSRTGHSFWGCSSYPRCHYILENA